MKEEGPYRREVLVQGQHGMHESEIFPGWE